MRSDLDVYAESLNEFLDHNPGPLDARRLAEAMFFAGVEWQKEKQSCESPAQKERQS